MRLHDYIKTNYRSIYAFVLKHGFDYAHIHRIIHKKRRPSPDLAARISAATNGEVSIMELLFPNGIPGGKSRGPDSVVEEREGDTGHI